VRVCSICTSPARADIDAALETDRSLRDIAAQFGVSKTALHRHWQTHVPEQAAQPPSRIGTSTTTQRGSRLLTIAKWVLIAGFGLGVLVLASTFRGTSPPGGAAA